MKKAYLDIKFFFCILLFVSGSALTGCDNIDEGDRVLDDVDESSITKTVLLEDFTGANCINCPDAHKIAQKSKETIGDNLVVVSIHAGIFSTPKFRTEAGDAYQKHFYANDMTGYPAAMISRTRIEGSVTTTAIANWNTYLLEYLFKPKAIDINIELGINYSEADNSFTVESAITPNSDYKDIKLQLWITESHIIAAQKTPTETIRDYEHNHVLRDAINGIWGEEIENDIEKGETKVYTSNPYSLEGKAWVPENISIVGFLYDANTEEVLDVKEIKLINQ